MAEPASTIPSPTLFIARNNGFAISTPSSEQCLAFADLLWRSHGQMTAAHRGVSIMSDLRPTALEGDIQGEIVAQIAEQLAIDGKPGEQPDVDLIQLV